MPRKAYGYDGSAWREAATLYAYDGTAWRNISTGYVYDGSSWRKFWPRCTAQLDTASQSIGTDGADGCGVGKCLRSVDWTWTGAQNTLHHIRILRSLNGGSYFEQVDDLGIGSFGSGSWDDGCISDGTSTQYKVRLEDDGTDTLACEESTNEITTTSLSSCVGV